MTTLRLALLADGAGDRALLPILSWGLRSVVPEVRFFEPEFHVHKGRLESVLDCVSQKLGADILFVHRDAERETLEFRRGEIPMRSGLVRVVPVRMTEAWLLVDEQGHSQGSWQPERPREAQPPEGLTTRELAQSKGQTQESPARSIGTHVPTQTRTLRAGSRASRAPRGGVHRGLLHASAARGIQGIRRRLATSAQSLTDRRSEALETDLAGHIAAHPCTT